MVMIMWLLIYLSGVVLGYYCARYMQKHNWDDDLYFPADYYRTRIAMVRRLFYALLLSWFIVAIWLLMRFADKMDSIDWEKHVAKWL